MNVPLTVRAWKRIHPAARGVIEDAIRSVSFLNPRDAGAELLAIGCLNWLATAQLRTAAEVRAEARREALREAAKLCEREAETEANELDRCSGALLDVAKMLRALAEKGE